jgi:hypothetical protein
MNNAGNLNFSNSSDTSRSRAARGMALGSAASTANSGGAARKRWLRHMHGRQSCRHQDWAFNAWSALAWPQLQYLNSVQHYECPVALSLPHMPVASPPCLPAFNPSIGDRHPLHRTLSAPLEACVTDCMRHDGGERRRALPNSAPKRQLRPNRPLHLRACSHTASSASQSATPSSIAGNGDMTCAMCSRRNKSVG